MYQRIVSIVALIIAITLFLPLTDCQASKKKKDKIAEGAEVSYMLGLNFFQKGDYLSALKELLKSEGLDKKNPDTQYLLGTTYFHLKRYVEAEQHLMAAIALKEKDPEGFPQARNNLGNVYLTLGRYDEAIEQFQECLGYIFYQPFFTQTYTNLGIAYMKKGDNENALQSFKTAIKLDPKYCPAHLNIGELYSKMERHQEAVLEYQKVVEICGGIFIGLRAQLYLGVELNTLGRRGEACEQFYAVLADATDTELAAKAGEYIRLLHCR